jgi:uncharacterized protein
MRGAAVVRDPRERVDDDGVIVTGADADRVPARYAETLDDAVATLSCALGDTLHSVYLYGSVATGQASAPSSDIDLVVVLEHPAPEVVAGVAAALSDRHRHLAREVSIGSVDLATLRRRDRTGHAERCFLKHYTVHLAGPDLRTTYPRCRATPQLAAGFNGDLRVVLDRVRARLLEEDDERQRGMLAAGACRKMLMAAATLLSVREGGWTTDRDAAVELVARHAPTVADLAADARRRCDQPQPVGAADVLEIVDRFGGWLADEYERLAGP